MSRGSGGVSRDADEAGWARRIDFVAKRGCGGGRGSGGGLCDGATRREDARAERRDGVAVAGVGLKAWGGGVDGEVVDGVL